MKIFELERDYPTQDWELQYIITKISNVMHISYTKFLSLRIWEKPKQERIHCELRCINVMLKVQL